ncbi:head GIN domain-containing protein [Flavihumibacter sp. CACIAM 22H1]|uniref:head GIN domain-containing protein n=1 Tax=Flavihumibacter sp. CACIAM 22H1 TaxID=1812911 RepID=UPI0007A8DB42|nr:head GIN domain-containing protein [Flavihumibacter sp. CACIAM 22H1]KYP15047.1 MAG: hypothetical protein A1D16_01265 [Flavihumibacter sp. CACIAM 22H1]
MKKNQLFFVFVLILFSAVFTACTKVNGKGPVVSEIRTVGSFNRIDFATSGRLYYKAGAAHRVEIRAQRNIQDVLEAYVSNGELNLKIKNNTVIHSYETIEVYIESPDINAFKVNGSGDIYSNDPIETDRLYTEVKGSGKIDIQSLEADELEARISGSGDVLVRSGAAAMGHLEISGSGDMNLIGLQVADMTTRTSGSGDIRLWATEKLDAKITGSGSVRYKGNPQLTVQVSGSGTVSPY